MAKSIREVMTSKICSIDADKPVAYAAKMMKDENVGFAPIVEGKRLVGTVTDRDIAVKAVAEGKDPQTTLVREIAETNIVTVEPEQDLDEALSLMASHQVRRLPVVEQDLTLVGVVAQADVAKEAKPKKVGEMVEDISAQ
jgi:CBS domain-containing protein